ncbi:uncharacterized protein LOC133324877 [Musca vetustissima]|uniref:uncharacterized protein LOC133324877 n=1 Tax=Musca vetustissima TaxID=27455 RepID=UPI002AB64520|nr:uncharacterized protein LOC133324877 [Musca vetustissima]
MQEEGRLSNNLCRYIFEDPKLNHLSSFLSKNPTRYEKQFSHDNTSRKHQINKEISSGGDADRSTYDNYLLQNAYNDISKFSLEAAYVPRRKHDYHQIDIAHDPLCKCQHISADMSKSTQKKSENRRQIHETESLMERICNRSEGSEKSQRSSKTVISRRSSQDLRQRVRSQCKLAEEVSKLLETTQVAPVYTNCDENKESINIPQKSIECEHCTHIDNNDVQTDIQSQQKDVMTEIGRHDFTESSAQDKLTITADEIVSSKVINPMIRKLQRMRLNNLREEMSLMEDLERLPHKVNEVYKASVSLPDK